MTYSRHIGRLMICLALLVMATACSKTRTPVSPSPAGTTLQLLRVEGPTSMNVGDRVQLKATVVFSDGSEQDVTGSAHWSTANADVLAVSPSGVVEALREGGSSVTATVDVVAGQLTLTVTHTTMASGPAGESGGSGAGSNAGGAGSSDEGAGSDSGGGGPGQESAVVRLDIKGNTTVAVGASSQLTLIATMADGTTEDVTDRAAWSSANGAVASVQAGLFTGQGVGTTTIEASFRGLSASVSATVSPATQPGASVSRLILSGNSAIQIGQTSQLTAIAEFSDGSSQDVTGQATWQTGDDSVATVAAGVLTGRGTGSTVVSATFGGKSAEVSVSVTGAPQPQAPTVTGITVSGNLDLCPITTGASVQLAAVAHFSDGSTADITADAAWSVDNPLLASIGSNGVLTVLLPGLINVRATYQGFTATAALNVCIDLVVLSVDVQGDTSISLAQFLLKGLQLSAIANTNLGTKVDCTTTAQWSLSGDNGLLGIVNGLVSTLGGVLNGLLGNNITATATCDGASGSHIFRITLL